ncbi:MAG: hypothetical protein RIM80_21195, partial [Alphaproteobacteria bacterium]
GAAPIAWTRRERLAAYTPIVLLAAVTMTIGLWTEPFAAAAMQAGEALLNKEAYIAAVLGPADAGTVLANLEITR